MSTHAVIVMKTDHGVKSIYVHWDGMPEHTGKILKEYYNTQQKVEDLIALGDLSYLDKNIDAPAGHTFNNPVPGYTIAYGRDRKEKNTMALEFEDLNEVIKAYEEKYYYYWNGQKWSEITD